MNPSRVSLVSMIAVVVMVTSLIASDHFSGVRTAAIFDTETTFDQPRPVEWSGYISRVFVGGEGIEVVSSSSEGGVFQAYMPIGQVSPITSGSVVVRGLWIGSTCAYGGHDGVCVPEVSIQDIQPHD